LDERYDREETGRESLDQPVLVFTNAFVNFGKPVKGVYYLNKKYLLKLIAEHKAPSPAGLKLWEMRRRI